jgi:hypothetical protein
MPQSFAELLAPLPLCVFLVNGLFAALVGAIQVAPLAHAFRQLGGRAEAAPAVKSAVGSPWS